MLNEHRFFDNFDLPQRRSGAEGNAMTPAGKLAILNCVAALEAGGLAASAACAASGVSQATVSRWRRAYAAGGVDALQEARRGRCGRHPVAMHLDADARAYLRRLAAGCGSQASAMDDFLDSPSCPPQIREALAGRKSRHHIPVSIRRAMAMTPEMQAMWNGPKQFAQTAFIQHRDMTMISPTGDRVQIQPGDWWELDDQSTNQPFWFDLEPGQTFTRQSTADRLAERHGVAIGRQGLFCVDVASGMWMAGELIGRPKDAYRAEDILRFLRRLFEDYGLPRFGIRLERGIWKSRAITGEKVEMPEEQRQIVVNGLRNLGIHVEYCYQSRGKPFVEGGFDHLQTRMSIEAMKRGWIDIGRVGRGDGAKERETQIMLRSKYGACHPKDAGFAHISELAAVYQEGFEFLNTHAKEGRLLSGIPKQKYQESVSSVPLRDLAPEHVGVFMPVKFETTLRGGHVSKTIDGREYLFGAPEIAARLGNGYRLQACFDPGDPWRGCELYSLEIGTRNVANLAPGAHIGCAEWSEAAPQFGFGRAETIEQRKRYSRAFRSVYAAAGLTGRRGRRILENRDGVGGVFRTEKDDAISRRGAEAQSGDAGRVYERVALTAAPARTDADLDGVEAEGKAAFADLDAVSMAG